MSLAMITARTMIELKSKIYKIEGWQRKAGESMALRIKQKYDVIIDFKRNLIVATKRERTQ